MTISATSILPRLVKDMDLRLFEPGQVMLGGACVEYWRAWWEKLVTGCYGQDWDHAAISKFEPLLAVCPFDSMIN